MATNILDRWGNPWVTGNFARSLESRSWRGPRQNNRNEGIERLIPGGDRRALAALSGTGGEMASFGERMVRRGKWAAEIMVPWDDARPSVSWVREVASWASR